MKFIITGHKGLIGRNLKKRLEKEGHKCVLSIDLRDKENPIDLKNINEIELKENADIFFHLAANCKINKCISDPSWSFENCLGVFNALEFCRKNNIKKFVNFSSSRVLSDEKNPYTASKIYGEELSKAFQKCYGISYITIRPSTVYGPEEDLTKRLMSIWIENARNNEDLIIYGDEEKTLDFTYIDDFIDGIMLAINKDWNKEYDISKGKGVKLVDVAKEIIRQTNSESKIVFEEQEKQQPQQVEVDISEIKKIGYDPKVDIYEGIKLCLKKESS